MSGLVSFEESANIEKHTSKGIFPQVSSITTDQEFKSDGFLALINSLLATGEIPGRLTKDDKEMFMPGVKLFKYCDVVTSNINVNWVRYDL